jgi:ribosomal protein L7Ae-like RNA K-turn-binding protein
MCQDVDYNVRMSMCEQLAALGRACGKDAGLSSLMTELFELLKDEEIKVSIRVEKSLLDEYEQPCHVSCSRP